MGKSSPSSCLKIIVCGSDAAENDGIHSPEAKTSSDKRGWSFRKRSGRHRVLGNNVSSESTPLPFKETPQGGSTDFQASVKPVNVDEKPQLPRPVEEISKTVATAIDSESKTSVVVVTADNAAPQAESKISQDEVASNIVSNETSAEDKMVDAAVAENDNTLAMAGNKTADNVVISENDSNETSDTSIASDSFVSKDESIKSDEPRISVSGMALEDGLDANVIVDEPSVIIIQSAMRRFLARRRILQLKSAVKLQAVIRGHLVRRNAAETLHCMRAIIKVQALVRARSSKSLGQKYRPTDAQSSTVKLLQNSFTRQLLKSTSNPKSLNIRCDPMRPNSSWSWLERWMSVSTSEAAKRLEPNVESENEVQKMTMPVDAKLLSVAPSDSIDSKFNIEEGVKLMESEESFMTDEVVSVGSRSASLSTDMIGQSHLQNQEIVIEDVSSAKMEAIATETSHTEAQSISHEENKPDTPAIDIQEPKLSMKRSASFHEENKTDTPAIDIQEPKLSMKRSASSDLNEEGKKFVFGSRKASNPAFIAAHSKFEELTTTSNPGKTTISFHQDLGAESHVESAPYSEESVKKATQPSDVETFGTFDPRIHVARSECGTEISVTSTLDSPDKSDIENAEAERDVQFLEQTSCQPVVGEKQDCEDGMPSMIQAHETDNILVDSVVAEVSPRVEDKLETNASDVQTDIVPPSSVTTMDSSTVEEEQENGDNMHLEHESTTAYKSSPEASPLSRRTVQESQGTPSSQASVKDKRNKVDKRGSNRKRSSPSSGKKSLSSPNVDSGTRSSTEQLPKDHKSGKRRNSFGSTKSDNADQEPRDSSSRNSLPSYMQATESARAKANSPRSSPDVHDKEVHSKKRHSLPGAAGKQGSAHIHRSTPQAAQSAKANGSNPSNEKKWQR